MSSPLITETEEEREQPSTKPLHEDGQHATTVRGEPDSEPTVEPSSGEEDQEAGQHRRSMDEPSGAESDQPKRPMYKRPVPLAIGVLFLVALAVGLWVYLIYARQFVSTDDAFLEGNLVQVAPQVAGPVTKLPVDSNDHVQKGDLLVRIDPTPFETALNRAQAERQSAAAKLQQAQAGLAVARAGVTVAQADVEQSQARVQVAQTKKNNAAGDVKRYQEVDPDAVPRQKIDNAKDRLQQTKAELAAAKQHQASSRAEVKSAQAKIASAKASIQTAKASIAHAQTQIAQAKLKLSYTTITAPAEGQIAKLNLEEGEYVKPGQALMALVPSQIWIRANFKETQITHMRPGQPVEIEIDAYPGKTYEGHVQSLQRGTGSEFSLLPPQNATGNFVKVVQRLPVKILFDDPPAITSMAPGMSVQPTVRIRPFQWWPWWPAEEDQIEQGQKKPAVPLTTEE